MTFEQLKEVIEKNNIPATVELMSDSGWECDATYMEAVYYNRDNNILVFTQFPVTSYDIDPNFEFVYGDQEEHDIHIQEETERQERIKLKEKELKEQERKNHFLQENLAKIIPEEYSDAIVIKVVMCTLPDYPIEGLKIGEQYVCMGFRDNATNQKFFKCFKMNEYEKWITPDNEALKVIIEKSTIPKPIILMTDSALEDKYIKDRLNDKKKVSKLLT